MKNQLDIRSFIRPEKTLIIACHDHLMEEPVESHENVYVIRSSGNVIHRHHYRQQEELRYFIETKRCKQILVVGHLHAEAIEQIRGDRANDAPLASLKFQKHPAFRLPERGIMNETMRGRLMVELNVARQCQVLMEYDFIHRCVKHGKLTVMGVVAATPDREATAVFFNDIVYNNLIALN